MDIFSETRGSVRGEITGHDAIAPGDWVSGGDGLPGAGQIEMYGTAAAIGAV